MKNRKVLSFLLVFAMLITLIVPLTVTTVSADAMAITSQAELAAMSASGNYYLANNITISGTWDYSANQFTGTFDGRGHTIRIANGATLKGGIFNQIGGGAVIKDLTIRQLGTATYTVGKEYQDGEQGTWSIGVLAGSCRSNWDARETARLIQNVTVYADISTSNNTYNVGGLVGQVRCAKVVFEGCAFYGSITNSGSSNASRSAGGIVGAGSYYINGLLIKNCINFGLITTGGNAGGIFGSQNETGTVQGTGVGSISIDGNSYSYGDTMYVIDGCMNYGSVTSGATYAGGIAAKIFNDGWRGFSVNYNINYGAVTSTGSGSSVGGIVGIFSSGRNDEAPWMEVVGNVNYGACTATNGTVLPILVSSNKILDNKGNNYCDTSTANGSGTNTPTVTVISNASDAATTLNTGRADSVLLGADGKIVAKLAYDTGKAPVAITSQAELAAMSPSGNYYLANDITINGTWDYSANQFTGIFDGRGHTIYLADGATLAGGIFNQISGGAIVKDLTIYQLGKATYTIGQEYQDGTQSTYGVGVLAGCVRSNWDFRTTTILIKNITVYADVEVSDNSDNVGGLVGHVRCARAIFEGCAFHGSVTNSGSTNENRAAGGIIGGASYYINGLLIKDCINFGTITTGGQAGGIFGGQNESSSIQDSLGLATAIVDGNTYGDYGNQIYVIDGCVNYGSVTGSAATAGGIAGRVRNNGWRGFSVNFNINYGAVTNYKSGGYAAGIAAELYNGYSNEDPWIEVIGNVNYGVCTASTGTKLPIIVTSNKTLDGKTNNYCDNSTSNGTGTNTPTVTVISNASGASSALSALNTQRANSFVLNDGKITAKWAYDADLAPFIIHSQADLAAMLPTGNYYLANDVTISGIWDYSANVFTGRFDGNNRTIYIANGTNLAGGIFNQIGGGAVIQDLTIRQIGTATYTPGQDYQDGTQTTRSVGVLAGSCRSNWSDRATAMLIRNVTVYADIEVSNNDWNVGGLVGQVQTARVIFDGCVFRGSVTNSGDPHELRGAGGIVGAASNYLNGLLIKDCVSFGTVSTGGQAGGIFGGVTASSSIDENNLGSVTIGGKTYDYGACLIIDGCVNYGSVTGRAANAGGIAGLLNFGSWHGILLNFNINYGTVTNNKSSGGYAGGIGGTISSSDSRYYLEVIGNVNYGVCTASGGTVAAITVSCSKSPTNSNNYCDSSTATGGTNAPGTSVLSNSSATSSAITSLNNARANAVILSDGKIASRRAVNAGLILAGGAIHNQAELAAMSPTGNYYLANDVTISGIWDYSANQFTGTFDGNGYTIYIANNATLKGGIFNQISGGAIVKNLTIRQLGKATYTIGQDYQDGAQNTYCVGVLAGSCRSDWSDRTTAMLIKNVTVYADVEVSNTGYNVGGLVGHVRCARVIFDGCAFHGSVTNSNSTNEYRGAGGIVGVASYYVNGLLFKNCINYGTIKTGGLAGGILGGEGEDNSIQDSMGVGSATMDGVTYSYGDSQIFIFDGCINYGSVTGNASNVGGITAKLKNNGWRGYGLNRNINYGAVTNTYSGGNAGGIAGRLSSTYGTEDPWIEVNNNINYGVCTATGGTALPIIVSSEKALDGKSGNYCDTSTANGSGTNTPTVTVISNSSGAASAVAALSTSNENALVVSSIDGKIIPKWAENLAAYRFTENYQARVSLSLEGTIILNFGVAANYPIPESCEFVVKKSGSEIARYSVASAYDDETQYYICGVPVNAKEMTERFTYTISIEKAGTTVWAGNYTLSIKQYADTVLSSVKYSSWYSLINAMLSYGAAAQNYFGYNTESPAANISGGISIDMNTLPSYTISGDRSFLQQIRASLNLEAGTDLNFYFKPATPGANLTATVRKGGSVVSSGVETEWVEDSVGTANVFLAVRIKGLAADALDDWYDITVTDGSKSVTIHYSGLCWVKVILNSNESETVKTLARGIGVYAQAAIALENAVFPLYLSINRGSSYEIVYGSTDSEYLISAAMSASKSFADDSVQIPAVATLTSGKKPITLTVNGSITGWRIEFADNSSITVKGNSAQMVINGLQYLLNSMISKDIEGDLLISNPTTVSDTATAYTRSGWQLAAPAYEGGTLASHLYNDGSGLDLDGAANATRSYMMCVSSTNSTQFNSYTQKLVNNGYVLDSQNSTTSSNSKTNLFRQYKKGNQLIYCYFNAETGVARIIDDRASTPETEFEYSFSSSTSTTTELVMYGMKYHPQGLDYGDEGGDPDTRNNGAFYIIKQADNSVFLIDGGGSTQATDEAIEGLWTYLHTLTGTAENGTINISCWYLTHAHNDHYALVAGLIARYHDKLNLQRVMFNFPSTQECDFTFSQNQMRNSILAYFPNVMFMKCHTGQSIHLGSMTIDIITTHEDMVSGTTGLTIATSGNSTSTAIRFTFADGTKFMCLGDLEIEQQDGIIQMYRAADLKCEIIEVAHHGYNLLTDLYKKIIPTASQTYYALWPNYEPSNFTDWHYEITDKVRYRLDKCGVDYIYYAGLNTVKVTCKNNKTITVSTSSVVY